MSKDHTLPASFIARFAAHEAAKKNTRSRNKQVWVRMADHPRAHLRKASSFGFVNDLYTTCSHEQAISGQQTGEKASFDKWKYEERLGPCLDQLEAAQTISLSDWLHVLVPFVAGLFVRGDDFDKRYSSIRQNQLGEDIAADQLKYQINCIRHLSQSRLLAPIMAAHWTVFHLPPEEEAISNNFGLIPMLDTLCGRKGWAIPLSPKTVLGLFPETSRTIAQYNESTASWEALFVHRTRPLQSFDGMNRMLAASATGFIFGANQTLVEKWASPSYQPSAERLASLMERGWSNPDLLFKPEKHRCDWYVVACIADRNLTPQQANNEKINLDDIDHSQWHPFMLELPDEETNRNLGITIHGTTMHMAVD